MDRTRRPHSRLDVGIVGVGKVGSALGVALRQAGHRIVAMTTASPSAAERARQRLPGVPAMPADEVVAHSDLVLLAVDDTTLPGLVHGLAETSSWRAGQLVAHVSGAFGIEVLAPAISAKALPLALHPVMTFTGHEEDLDRIVGISYGVTAPPPLRPIAEALVLEMGGEPVWIDNHLRPLYHAALSIGANHLVTLIAESMDLLRKAGVSNPGGLLAPLAEAALDNALHLGDAGLTGPVVRGDANTVAAHLRALREHQLDAVPEYLAMARRSAGRAIDAGRLDAADAGPLLEVLAHDPHGTK